MTNKQSITKAQVLSENFENRASQDATRVLNKDPGLVYHIARTDDERQMQEFAMRGWRPATGKEKFMVAPFGMGTAKQEEGSYKTRGNRILMCKKRDDWEASRKKIDARKQKVRAGADMSAQRRNLQKDAPDGVTVKSIDESKPYQRGGM